MSGSDWLGSLISGGQERFAGEQILKIALRMLGGEIRNESAERGERSGMRPLKKISPLN